MKTKFLQNDYFKKQDAIELLQITNHSLWQADKQTHGITLKVYIHRTSYDEYSFGKVDFWNGKEWTHVLQKPIVKLRCHKVPCISKEGIAGYYKFFDDDACELRGTALQVVASKASLKANGNK
tara:strand:+ start:1945 stop:2313 length:369 start_codon:yes stop_codon:yes gene_type:complete